MYVCLHVSVCVHYVCICVEQELRIAVSLLYGDEILPELFANQSPQQKQTLSLCSESSVEEEGERAGGREGEREGLII